MIFFGRQRRFVAYMLLAAVTTCSTPSTATEKRLPLVISTWDFREANEAAWRSLKARPNDPLDALVTGCTTCERLQCDGSVGFGGSPDERGKTTLDAMIMDGATMNMGAVAGMHDVKNAIGVARMVLEHTRHSLLVGEAATEFAEAMGFPRESLTTDESEKMWRDWQKRQCQPNFWVNVNPDPRLSCGPYEPLQLSGFGDGDALQRSAYAFGPFNHDTIGMIVIDESGHIYAGTSTNGATYKIPGRVGDSPIPGAGAYADNEVGAAVATGDGDVMMRFLPSLIAVESMRRGLSPAVASEDAMKRILKYYPDFSGGLVVADTKGNYAASCAGMDKFPFAISSGDGSDGTRVEYKVCDLSANKIGTK